MPTNAACDPCRLAPASHADRVPSAPRMRRQRIWCGRDSIPNRTNDRSMAKKAKANADTGANIGFDASLGITAAKLLAGQGDYAGAKLEDLDGKAENVFWVPADARSSRQQANGKQTTIGSARLAKNKHAAKAVDDLGDHPGALGSPGCSWRPSRRTGSQRRAIDRPGHATTADSRGRPLGRSTTTRNAPRKESQAWR